MARLAHSARAGLHLVLRELVRQRCTGLTRQNQTQITDAFGLPLNEERHLLVPQSNLVLDHTLRVFAATCKMEVQ